jgi:hypothetical protein
VIGFTPPRLGRKHLLFGAALVVIGLVLVFDAFSSRGVYTVGFVTRNSWFFQNSYDDVEWAWGLVALAGAVVWVGGSVGWWIVRSIIWNWFRHTKPQ